MIFDLGANKTREKEELNLRSFSAFLLGDKNTSGRFIETQRRLVDLADRSGFTFTESDLSRALSKTVTNKKALANIKEKILAQLKTFSIGLAKEILRVPADSDPSKNTDTYNLLLEKQLINSFCACLEKSFQLPMIVVQSIMNYRKVEANTTDTVEYFSQIIAAILAYTCTPHNYCESSGTNDDTVLHIGNVIVRDGESIQTLTGGSITTSYLDSMLKTLLKYEEDISVAYDYKRVDISINDETGLVTRNIEVVQKLYNPSKKDTVFEMGFVFHAQLSVKELIENKFDNLEIKINNMDFIDYLKKHRTAIGDDLIESYEQNPDKRYNCFFNFKDTNSIKNILKTRRFVLQIPIPSDLEEVVLKYNMISYSSPRIDSIAYTYRSSHPCQRFFHEFRLVDSPNWVLMGFLFPLVVSSVKELKQTNLTHYGPNRECCTFDVPIWQPPGFGYMLRVKNTLTARINDFDFSQL